MIKKRARSAPGITPVRAVRWPLSGLLRILAVGVRWLLENESDLTRALRRTRSHARTQARTRDYTRDTSKVQRVTTNAEATV